MADDAFLLTIEPLRSGLRLHCYRMLGSSSDSDDVMQEVIIRAWLARASLSSLASLKPWLYRIATNVCLDELQRRPRRALASDRVPVAADPRAAIMPPVDEPVWLEPMPSAWLEGAPDHDPAARVTLRESVALAFVAALQGLSAMQRATLLLRDVVGFSAEETAEALGVTAAAANSALFRARSAVEERRGGREAEPPSRVDEEVVARYVRAWESSDLVTLVALLREDVETTMPPSPTWVKGREANHAFHEAMFANNDPARPLRIVPTGANGQPALAWYRAPHRDAPLRLTAIQVLELRDGEIARIDHFMGRPVLAAFGLEQELPPPS